MESRDISWTQRDQTVTDPKCDEETERAANERDDETFNQELLDDLAASRPDCRVNRELSCAGSASSGKQIG